MAVIFQTGTVELLCFFRDRIHGDLVCVGGEGGSLAGDWEL